MIRSVPAVLSPHASFHHEDVFINNNDSTITVKKEREGHRGEEPSLFVCLFFTHTHCNNNIIMIKLVLSQLQSIV